MVLLAFFVGVIVIYFGFRIVLGLFVPNQAIERGEDAFKRVFDSVAKWLVVLIAGLILYFFVVLPIFVHLGLRQAP